MANPIMKYFDYAHLPAELQEVSRPVGELAKSMDLVLTDGPEKSFGLRKLLEAKDCFVRASLPIAIPDPDPLPVPDPLPNRKYNPGHYLALYEYQKQSDIRAAAVAGVKGVNKRYSWGSLETSLGVYDFSEIESDLALAASLGLQFVALIQDKSFKPGLKYTPVYLQGLEHTRPNPNGFTAVRYHPFVVERFNALIAELGYRFDDEPFFEGVAFQESAIGFNNETLLATGYTPELYRDALISMLISAANFFPNSQVFWYMNFLKGNQGYLAHIADAVAPFGVTMGGPDVNPDVSSLQRLVHPLYEQFKDRMNLFCSVQNSGYQHEHADTTFPTKYWTPLEMFEFARDSLHVKYLFWNYNTGSSGLGTYNWGDAMPVIASNPEFNLKSLLI